MISTHDPLDPIAIAAAKDIVKRSPKLEAGQSLTHLYNHWVASQWQLGNTDGGCSGSYNYLIDLRTDPSKWQILIPTDPRLNAVQVGNGPEYAAHTYLRNSHALGISLACMGGTGVNEHYFGPNPLQAHELEMLCAANAAICAFYGIPITLETLMTHGEAAILDSYFVTDHPADGVTRWDLARFAQSPAPLTKPEAVASGNAIRARTKQYHAALS